MKETLSGEEIFYFNNEANLWEWKPLHTYRALNTIEALQAQRDVLMKALQKEKAQGNGWVDENTNHIDQALSTLPAEALEAYRLKEAVVEAAAKVKNALDRFDVVDLEPLSREVQALEAHRKKKA